MQLHAFDVLCRPPQDTKKIFWSFVARMLVGVVAVVAAVASAVWAEVWSMPPAQYTILTKRVCLQTFEIDASQAYTRVDPRYVSFTIDSVGDIRACLRHKIHTVDCELIGCLVWLGLRSPRCAH